LQSLTLLAVQIDFTEAGELLLFISESEIAVLGNMMWKKGYSDGEQMAGTFQTLHANELIWLKRIDDLMIKIKHRAIHLLAKQTILGVQCNIGCLSVFKNKKFNAGRTRITKFVLLAC
jgi:poly(3-hydroxyalkanoate) synthetase